MMTQCEHETSTYLSALLALAATQPDCRNSRQIQLSLFLQSAIEKWLLLVYEVAHNMTGPVAYTASCWCTLEMQLCFNISERRHCYEHFRS